MFNLITISSLCFTQCEAWKSLYEAGAVIAINLSKTSDTLTRFYKCAETRVEEELAENRGPRGSTAAAHESSSKKRAVLQANVVNPRSVKDATPKSAGSEHESSVSTFSFSLHQMFVFTVANAIDCSCRHHFSFSSFSNSSRTPNFERSVKAWLYKPTITCRIK